MSKLAHDDWISSTVAVAICLLTAVVGDRPVEAHSGIGIGEGDFVAFIVDIQTDELMMWLHELAS